MKRLIALFLCWTAGSCAVAQRLVFDPGHFAAVVQNGSIQSAAEITHNQFLTQITGSLQAINTNMGALVLVQTMIYQSLSQVNAVLKEGLMVKDLAATVADIASYTDQAIVLAKIDPYLLLFAQNYAGEIKMRAFRLTSDVSGFILKQGGNVLADYSSRDELLSRVRRELQIIDGMAYGAWRAMYWAKEKGVIASLNPFAAYLNADQSIVAEIIHNATYLKK